MNKQKKTFTTLDISAIVKSLRQKIVGLRLANIFDINNKTYVLKFAKNEKKECLLIENGIRIHTTTQKLQKKSMPSGFTMKFRKYLKSKLCEYIQQIGVERVIDIKFGSENGYHLLLEFYSQGNIILTDKDYRVIQLMRSHKYTEDVETAVGEVYPFSFAANMSIEKMDLSQQRFQELVREDVEEVVPAKMAKKFAQKEKGKKIKDVMFKAVPCFSPAQIDHFIKSHGLNPNDKCSDIPTLQNIAQNSLKFLKDYIENDLIEGYIIQSDNISVKKQMTMEEMQNHLQNKEAIVNQVVNQQMFVEFTPFLMAQHQNEKSIHFADFNEAVDVYFQNIQAAEQKNEVEIKAWKKYENIKQDQERRLKILYDEQQEFVYKALLIEQNTKEVDAIVNILNMMVSGGLSWETIDQQIKQSRKNADPLAMIIHKINWLQNEVIVLLENLINSEQDMIQVSINLNLNAFQNADSYYQQKKKHAEKEKKTVDAASHAIKVAEQSVKKEIEQKKVKVDVLNNRKQFWFEKFYWFISSENYLILSGKDQQQNELLVKKYLEKDDIYMHADYHGAASTVIKNHNPKFHIPRATLEESAIAAICRSKAWDQKIISEVWWVYADQVSKSAPSGEYLPTGSFMIRGKKNFIYPQRMEMGLTLLFRLDESCAARHLNERRVKEELVEKGVVEKGEEIQLINTDIKSAMIDSSNWAKGNNTKNQKNQEKQQEKKQNEKQQKKQEEKKEEKIIKNPNGPRGQKQKLEKLKKYKDQDEDELEIKLKLLGAKKMKVMLTEEEQQQQIDDEKQQQEKLKNAKGKGKKEKENKKKPDEKKQPSNKANQEIETIQKLKEEVENQQQKQLLQKQKIQEEKLQSQEKEEQKKGEDSEGIELSDVESIEEKAQPTLDEKDLVQEDEIIDKQTDLLTGNPSEEDIYFFCIPMCAPYVSLQQNYKFKTKLTPGTLKKGRAAKSAVYLWTQQQDANPTDKKMMRSITDNELVQNMIGNVKVSGAGLQKLKDKEKQDKKKAKKLQHS